MAGLGFDEYSAQLLGLGKTEPGQSYIVTDARENPRKPLNELSSFKRLVEIEAEAEPGAANADTGIKLIPVKSLHVAKQLFQNREADYSEQSVNRIIKAVNNGTFNWGAFDAITVWVNPQDNKTYILSGHSRSEAFRRLAERGLTAQGRAFDNIPAKYFDGTLSEAREFALKSNTLATKETDVERANYYRSLRANGTPERDIKDEAKENEGRDWNRVYNYSFLDANGKTIAALTALEAGETQSRAQLQSVASWIGKARSTWPELQLLHENELYDWLINNNAYGTKAGQISNERDFLTRVGTAVNRNTYFGEFKADEPLNILSKQYLSPIELEHKQLIAEAENELAEAKKALELKRKQLVANNITGNEFDRIIKPYDEAVNIATRKVLTLKNQSAQVTEAAKAQTSLFGTRVNLGSVSHIAKEIANQIGNKAFVMLGAYNLLADGDALSFRFKGSKTFNYLKISLNHRDLYDLHFAKIGKGEYGIPTVKSEKTINDVYVDMLHEIIEQNTGLYTSIGATEIVDNQAASLDYAGYKPTYTVLADYSQLIERSSNTITLTGTGGLNETIELIQKTLRQNIHQTEKLAKHLYHPTPAQYIFNVWHWMKTNLKYNYDPAGKEWVRTPARTYADRFSSGADCEDFTIFACSLFINAGLRPKMRIVAFNGKAQYGHIYPVCNGIVADAVMNEFNKNPDFITKTMELYALAGTERGYINGLGELAPVSNVTQQLLEWQDKLLAKIKANTATKDDYNEYSKVRMAILANGTEAQAGLLALMPFVKRIRQDGHFIFKSPLLNTYYYNADAIDGDNLTDAEKRDLFSIELALDQSAAFVDDPALAGIDDDDDLAGLGKTKKKFKDTKVGKAIKKVGKAIKKVAPPLVAARAAWLLIAKANIKKYGHKLAVGYLSEAQAKAKGIDLAKWRKYVAFKNKAEDGFKKAGGNPANLRKAVAKSKAAKRLGLSGVDGLGEPITITAVASAAIPVVLAVLDKMQKDAGVADGDLGIDQGAEENVNTLSLNEADGFTSDDQRQAANKAVTDNPDNSGDNPPADDKKGNNWYWWALGGSALLIGAYALRK